MVRKALVGMGLSFAASGMAFAQINTQCQQLGQFTNCQTNGQLQRNNPVDYRAFSGPDVMESYRQGQRMAAEQQAAERAQRQYAQQQAANDLRREVGRKVAGGDCQGGEEMALSNGDFGLAQSVRDYCASPKP